MEIAPRDIISLALESDYADCVAALARVDDLGDPWLLAACLHAIGHLARRHGRYPGAEAARFWAEALARPDEQPVAGALEDAEEGIVASGASAA